MVANLVRLIARYRGIVIILTICLTIFFGYQVSKIKLYDDPNRWPPANDRNVVINDFIAETFGGANLVTIQVMVKDGDIFNPQTLAKVKRISDKILLMHGVIQFYLTSVSDIKVKYMKGTEDLCLIEQLMEHVPETPEAMERLKYGITHNPLIYGSLVSPDFKATVIICDFRTGLEVAAGGRVLPRTDPVRIYKEIKKIIDPENDANHIVQAAGSPIIIGWVNSEGLPYIFLAFGLFLVAIAIILWFAFKRIQGVLFPLLTGFIACVWAFGIWVLLAGSILKSASAFMVPFIIMAAVGCHSVQLLKRFYQEYQEKGRHLPAVTETLTALLPPLFTSLITDITGFGICVLVPFDNVSLLGGITALGLISLIITYFIFLLPILSYFPGGPEKLNVSNEMRTTSRVERWIYRWGELMVAPTRTRFIVAGIIFGILGLSVATLHSIDPGQDNTYAIHNFLTKSWKNHPIYLMEMNVKERFKGVYPLNILIEAKKDGGLGDPAVLRKIDNFATYLEKKFPDHVAGTMHLPVYIKLMHRFFNNEDDKYFQIPNDPKANFEYLYMYSLSEPGSFDSVIDRKNKMAVLVVYVDNTGHDTVRDIYEAADNYAVNYFNDGDIVAKVGGGAIGIAKAFNENIGKWMWGAFLLSAAASGIVVYIFLRSGVAVIFLLLPLTLASIIWLSLMYILGIEINSNATLSIAIGMGVGIDSEFYLLYRFREELKRMKDFDKAITLSLSKIFGALFFSNGALILGCWSLIPISLYVGYVGFGMGMMLFICLLLGLTIFLILWAVFKPRFLFRGVEDVRGG